MNTPEDAEQRLQALNRRVELLASISSGLVFEYALETEDLRALHNPEFFLGNDCDEVLARIHAGEFTSPEAFIAAFVHKKDWSVAGKAHKELMQTGESRCNLRFLRDNQWVWGKVYCWLEYDCPGGKPVTVFGYIDDIASGAIHRGIIEKFVYSISDYFIYLDIPNNFYIRFNGSNKKTLFVHDEDSDYADATHDFVHHFVVEEDRAYAFAQMQPAKILEMLNRRGEHAFYVGIMDATGYRRKQFKYVYFDREKQLVLFTRFDVTTVYEEEREYNRKLKEALTLAQKDPLTGLYNKSATEQLIQNALSAFPEQTHAFMMLDIDNFKTINDNLGHMFGDAVLSEVSLKLKRLFRNNDIVGRVGGDEFSVLMTDIDDSMVAISKATEIVRLFRHSYTENGRVWEISVSVGITLSHGDHSFADLYQRADKALYTAKRKGKCAYHLYDETETYAETRQPKPVPVTPPAPGSGPKQIPQRFFDMLYSAVDVDTGVTMALALLGELYNVSRVYVLEQDPIRNTVSNTYEWCNKGIEPEKALYQNIPLAKVRYYNRFDANGVLHCPNVEDITPQLRGLPNSRGIRSMLQVLIMDSRVARGLIGFDECTRHRVFSQQEIDNLALVSKVLGTFILKKRFADQRNAAINAKILALDCQPHSIYVVDEDFHIVYANRPLMRLIPNGMADRKCYELFRTRSSPCPECPVVNYVDELGPQEIYNDFFNIWVQVTARAIPWEGVERAFLVSCVNITNTRRII